MISFHMCCRARRRRNGSLHRLHLESERSRGEQDRCVIAYLFLNDSTGCHAEYMLFMMARECVQSSLGAKLPGITPNAKCKLRLLKLERIKDWLLMEEEFVSNQERLKPQEERNEEDRTKACSLPPLCPLLCSCLHNLQTITVLSHQRHPSTFFNLADILLMQVDELRGSPMSVGSLEEIIDEK